MAEGLKQLARAAYDRTSEEGRSLVNQAFAKIDTSGDGRLSPLEFSRMFDPGLEHQSMFRLFDVNGDGSLDFDEFLAIYYYFVKLGTFLVCSGCGCHLLGPFFSCSLCLGKGNDTFDLCCACHRGGRVAHQHSIEDLMDHYSLIKLLRSRSTADAQRSQQTRDADSQKCEGIKRQMEELREIARDQHQAGSTGDQALAHQFFQSLDTNGDRKVDLTEFLAFTRREGYSQFGNPNFFSHLDKNGNGTLDFWEVLTLHYIIKSRRPFCDSCSSFIPGMFFSCVECFKKGEATFDLCRDCYKSMKWNHSHGGSPTFLDNYTLLNANGTRNN
ncbi:hypothetical protein F511_02804 [Dorcoceras hygrometricum]|uniref:EF-hand domain-containing protein n=1 Tax=Dorcoceras hygrometricum TaxID=472368 RepID=A0A2Z7BPZ3_9LAMI|nr:hypothetical protein F511_02804 [Dorcoceras hygrometricum]